MNRKLNDTPATIYDACIYCKWFTRYIEDTTKKDIKRIAFNNAVAHNCTVFVDLRAEGRDNFRRAYDVEPNGYVTPILSGNRKGKREREIIPIKYR